MPEAQLPPEGADLKSSSDLDLVSDRNKARRTGWPRRRKTWTVVGVLAVLVIIVVAVVVPVKLTRKSKPSYTYEELYFPQGFNGTGLNGALGGRTVNTTYDQLVAFGSSYSDNAHPRSSEFSATLAGSGYWNGRWSNGPVWTEYLRDYLGNSTRAITGRNVTHLNYAYGGATTNNSLIRANSPDTGEQVQMFIDDASYDPETKKPLVAMFTSTNPITGTFLRYWDSEDSAFQNRTAAMDIISEAAQSLTRQLASLIPSNSSLLAPDFLILPILPVELTLRASQLAAPYDTNTDLLRDITIQYNKVLMQGAEDLSASLRSGSRGNVFTYDVPAWMYAMQAYPQRYDLNSPIVTPCDECPNPRNYVFWDHLHLVTTMQHRLATTAFNIIRDSL